MKTKSTRKTRTQPAPLCRLMYADTDNYPGWQCVAEKKRANDRFLPIAVLDLSRYDEIVDRMAKQSLKSVHNAGFYRQWARQEAIESLAAIGITKPKETPEKETIHEP